MGYTNEYIGRPASLLKNTPFYERLLPVLADLRIIAGSLGGAMVSFSR